VSNVIDLAHRRRTPTFLNSLSHPAGVNLPFGDLSDAGLIIPEIRSAICDGTYSSDLIRRLPDVVRAGDRVLVMGAGLGVVSTLVAKSEGVARVIAVEPNITLIPYLKRVHALNGVPWVEPINAVLGHDLKGRVPFFARRDLRDSSPLPHDSPWEKAMMVPAMDLDLILTEEQISLIICEAPISSAQLLKCVEHVSVERVLLTSGDDSSEYWRQVTATHLVANHGQKHTDSTIPNCNIILSAPD
jgi:FkbM family methyltransferase